MRRFVVVGAIVVAVLAVWMWRRVPGHPLSAEAIPPAKAERGARLARALTILRDHQAANLKQHALPFDVARDKALKAALDAPENVKASLHQGQKQWMPTVLAMENLTFAREDRLACDRVLGPEIEKSCAYDLDVAVERTGPDRGTVRMVRSSAGGADAEPVCEAYADCRAQAYFGKEVPLPPGEARFFGLRQRLEAVPFRAELNDPTRVEADLQIMREGLEEDRATLDLNDPMNVYLIETLSAQIAYKQKWLDQLRR